VTNVIAIQPKESMRLRARSFIAFVLSPVQPIGQWLAELDKWSRNSPNFFAGKPIILDLAGATPSPTEIAPLITNLASRGIRIMAIEGADANHNSPSLPPILQRGRFKEGGEMMTLMGTATTELQKRQEPSSLLIQGPIRSGQSIAFPNGDVTVLGSVSAGAEVIAGGSIHVYGALRGRAMAGSEGNSRARIFCSRNEAELVSVDGYYCTAEQMDTKLRNQSTQCWLEGRTLSIAALH
jgi:septum site-determining protein MinC